MVDHRYAFSARFCCALAVLAVAGSCIIEQGVAGEQLSSPLSYNRNIRPILSDKCYFCHGPDPEYREAGLRLDTAEGSLDVIESGDFLDRIQNDDPDLMMPPPYSKLSLSSNEKARLAKWVDAGAKYEKHWSFEELPESVPMPEVKDQSWSRKDFDRFVLARLEREALTPTAEAAPIRWLRRATLHLTGLPPTLEEINAFEASVRSDGEAAYDSAVDRLLSSPAYGEHMAVAWLDAARYADSYGYQSDQLNTQWPYRDWVVRAFNDNLPYDEFLTWQLAGDLLENPTPDQRLATAFNRLHRLTNEGGAVYEEWRIENVADRVHTFGTAILGLTMECSRCHDHKYDPITMRDYYSLSAFFNSIDENGVYDSSSKVPSPTMVLPTQEQSQAMSHAQSKLEVAEMVYTKTLESDLERYTEWRSGANAESLELKDLQIEATFDKVVESDSSKNNDKTSAALGKVSYSGLNEVAVTKSPLPRMDNRGERRAVRLDGDRPITLQSIGPFDRWTPFTFSIAFREPKRADSRCVIAHHSAGTDVGYNGWDLLIDNGYVESRLYRVWPGNALGIRTVEPIASDRWHHLAVTYDGSSMAEGIKLYLDGKLLETEMVRDNVKKSVSLPVNNGDKLVVGQRFRSRGLAGGLVDEVHVFTRELSPTEINYLATGAAIEPTLKYYKSAIDLESRKALRNLTAARRAVVEAEERMHEIPVMEEMHTPRAAHILARGLYDAKTSDETLVGRDTFENILLPFPADLPRNRLGLAQWVTNPNHPLTARVAVNRMWRNFFGIGLVSTPENFGLQGELPTHPALLDWLSRNFVNNGWDTKRFCKNIVLSATYRQDSVVSPEVRQRDPENLLLARGPAFRSSAEQVRDMALAASGLLNRKFGGPPVSPYQAGGDLWKESNNMSPAYRQSVGKALHRRSVYSVWKRTAPLPNMMAFDATSREVCVVSRSRTNTPLQALVLLNDVQFVEASRALATDVIREYEDDDSRVNAIFRSFTSREPLELEKRILAELLCSERKYYNSRPEEAAKLIQLGDTDPSESLDTIELAAFTIISQTVLNLDATVWIR